jgi:hypothetical protein
VKTVKSSSPVDFEKLKTELVEILGPPLTEFNAGEHGFSAQQTSHLLKYVTQVFIRPIRLLMHPFAEHHRPGKVRRFRTVFRPVTPVPLEECVECFPVVREEELFPLCPKFPMDVARLEDLRQVVRQYTEEMIGVINHRYDRIDDELTVRLPKLTR